MVVAALGFKEVGDEGASDFSLAAAFIVGGACGQR